MEKGNTEIAIIKDNVLIQDSSAKIQNMIYVIREKQVMLDSDLALLYQVETKALNQAVKRHLDRFPEGFRFQLSEDEYESLRSQIVTSKGSGGRRYLPYVFTEQGIAMLSAVLKSKIAAQVSIRIMETFVEMRKYLANSALLLEKVNNLELRQMEMVSRQSELEQATNERFERVFDYIEAHKEENQKIFYDGQIFDAFSLISELIRQAEKTIVLIDGYVDLATLNILAKKKEGVDVSLYTLPCTKLTAQDIINFNSQYPYLKMKKISAFHDRFLILDNTFGYHIGASIKDAGKKCFGINKIEDIGVVNDLLQRVKLAG